jgi:asparaginyl-tRNA synthetase
MSLYTQSHTRIVDVHDHVDIMIGTEITVAGSIRFAQKHGSKLLFIKLSDGSCPADLLLVVRTTSDGDDLKRARKECTRGVSMKATGILIESRGKEQDVELKVTSFETFGSCPSGHPIPKTDLTMDYIRGHPEFRIVTQVMQSVMTIRNECFKATHDFFQGQKFQWIATPLITSSDCEGAGETFTVTTMMGPKTKTSDIPTLDDGSVDYEKDFFGKLSSLTVSGQLNVETYVKTFGQVYTFGPTFRAEDSNTYRHLAEFWMIEPEIAFADLKTDMDLAEDYVKYCLCGVLTNCRGALEILSGHENKSEVHLDIPMIEKIAKCDKFPRITYTDAIEMLEKSTTEFEFPVSWGIDLSSEHEKEIVKMLGNIPVFVHQYPRAIKAFYMKETAGCDPDRMTVQSMDLLVPGIGELIGGSSREDSYDRLNTRIEEVGVDPDSMKWYLDLRKYGACPSSGFGLGFERLVQFASGMHNIKDTIPFPRYPGKCDC